MRNLQSLLLELTRKYAKELESRFEDLKLTIGMHCFNLWNIKNFLFIMGCFYAPTKASALYCSH